jgi:hypothetical protein
VRACAPRSGTHDDEKGTRYASASSTRQEMGPAALGCDRAGVKEKLWSAGKLHLVSE